MGVLKLGGLASGLDTEGIVKQLMTLERQPVTLLQKRKDALTTAAGAWRDLNSRLLNLQSRLSDLKSYGNAVWSAKKASVADQTILTASADTTAQPGTYTVNVTALAKATTWEAALAVADPAAALGQAGTMTVTGGPGNAKTITVTAADSLNSIVSKINGDSTLGFTASVVQVGPGDNRLVLNGKNGAASDFSLSDTTGTVAAYLKVDAATGIKVNTAADGAATVNNIAVTFADNTVKNAIPGVTLNVLKIGTTTVSTAWDSQKALDAVKAFVDQYNSVIDYIGTQTSYDAKTKKAGTLFGESLVQSVQSVLSGKLGGVVGSLPPDKNALAMVGITTEKFAKGGDVSGKLTFDSAKFQKALTENPDAVMKLFTMDDGANKGVAVRTLDWLQNYTRTGGLVLNQVTTLDKQVDDIKERISYYDDVILPMKEERLRKQFNGLEKAMNMFQSQGQWLSQQLASLAPAKQ